MEWSLNEGLKRGGGGGEETRPGTENSLGPGE